MNVESSKKNVKKWLKGIVFESLNLNFKTSLQSTSFDESEFKRSFCIKYSFEISASSLAFKSGRIFQFNKKM
jgi:hypothetical protein